MIEIDRLTKRYGPVAALDGISFRVEAGEVVGFLGPNGAGKTTTMRILTGFLGPTSGRVIVGGFDVVERPIEARRCLGYMPEGAPLYPEMRVNEYLRFRAALKQIAPNLRGDAVEYAMERTSIQDAANQRIFQLSRGYRQRVALADALVADPPLLILDEPTAGLDPNQRRQVRRLIRELGRSRTVLLSSHVLSEVESTCQRAVVIHRGKLVAQGNLDELQTPRHPRAVLLRLRDPDGRGLDIIRLDPGVSEAAVQVPPAAITGAGDSQETTIRVDFSEAAGGVDVALERLIATLVAEGVGIREVQRAKASLEEIFAELTLATRSLAPEAPSEASS